MGVLSVHYIPPPLDVVFQRPHDVMCKLGVCSGASSWHVHLVLTYWGLIPNVNSGSGHGWPISGVHQSLEKGRINEQMNFSLNWQALKMNSPFWLSKEHSLLLRNCEYRIQEVYKTEVLDLGSKGASGIWVFGRGDVPYLMTLIWNSECTTLGIFCRGKVHSLCQSLNGSYNSAKVNRSCHHCDSTIRDCQSHYPW